jgi:thioesterase domain-containing protein
LNVTKIWERVLSRSHIAPQDNFFELGGHSLLAVRLVGEINKCLNASLTLQVFFLNPTVEGISRVVAEGNYAQPVPHLIPLRENPSGGAVFLLDASMAMCRLAQLLDPGPSLFATEVPLSSKLYRAAMSDKSSVLPSMEELAAPHVELIRGASFSGPCALAGHSFSGLLAFEVAHQLKQQGIEVDLILLVDTWVRTPLLWEKIKLLNWQRARGAVTQRMERLRSKATNLVERAVPPSPTVEQVDEKDWKLFSELTLEVHRMILKRIQNTYRLRPLNTRGVLFHSEDRRLSPLLPLDNGWQGLFQQGLEIVLTPGDHLSLLEVPHVHALAKHMSDQIASYKSNLRELVAGAR